MRRYHSNTVQPQTLLTPVIATDVTFNVTTTAIYPPVPFILGVDRGTGSEEVCLCTAIVDGTHMTVTRGYDGTTAKAHAANTSTVEHCTSAVDVDEPNAFINLMTTLGDVIVMGPAGAVRLGVGADGTMFTANPASANGVDWETAPPAIFNLQAFDWMKVNA